MVKDCRELNKVTWIKSIKKQIIGNFTYIVHLPELERLWKRHTNQIIQSDWKSDNILTVPIGYPIQHNRKNKADVDISNNTDCQKPKRNIKPPDCLQYI